MTATLSDLVETYQRHITVDCEVCVVVLLRSLCYRACVEALLSLLPGVPLPRASVSHL